MQVIAGYRIVRELGSGGTGTVYLTDPPAALKVVRPDVSSQPALRNQLIEGARLAARLDHPSVVRLIEHGESDGLLWTAMEFVAGVDADAELRAGRMEPARAVRIIAQVAPALSYIHSLGILHGDIKPANFLLSQDGSADERVLLADFEVARDLHGPPPSSDGLVLVSAAYAAPEVLLGHSADGRADVYSLGCALFRLMTGKPPFFDARSKAATIEAQKHQPPPRATPYAPWLPVAIDEVIRTAMAKDPDSRYPSAQDFADAVISAM